jgi:hypothetical protein
MLLLLFIKCELPNYYDVQYTNNTDFNICYHVADSYGKYKKTVYPDTTIFFEKRLATIKAKSYFIDAYLEISVEKVIEENIPSDTLSIFYFHADTVSEYSWEKIQREYKVLRRYDLSIEDIRLLYNKHDVPEIPYPPDERMKNMKMYPPYGTYNE